MVNSELGLELKTKIVIVMHVLMFTCHRWDDGIEEGLGCGLVLRCGLVLVLVLEWELVLGCRVVWGMGWVEGWGWT